MQDTIARTLTIIPAKSTSRRLPGKNARPLGGTPLVVRAVQQALASGVCGEVCVGTDSPDIARLAIEAGAAVPFLRQDDVDDVTPVGTAAANILTRYREELGRTFDLVCLLLVTSPLRQPEDIAACRDVLLADPELDASMSFALAEKHPYWAWTFGQGARIAPLFPDKCDLGKHQIAPAYYVDGAVYWARAVFFERAGGNQYAGRVGGYVLPAERAVDVDTPLDLALAELLLQREEKA
jgi:N-acylneuraminate cytidylyltransferase